MTTREERVEECRVAKARLFEMVLDEDWTGVLDTAAELRRGLPRAGLIAERWGDWAGIKGHVGRSVLLALASMDVHTPDGLEDAAVTVHHQGTGTQLRVFDVDTGQRIIEPSNVTGVSASYRWGVRDDGHGFRFENTDMDGHAL
jgi:hypothetical protein